MGKFGSFSTLLAMAVLLTIAVAAPLRAQVLPNETASEAPTILIFGDSIAAGYGLPPREGLTFQLAKAFAEAGMNVSLINAGVSGDTTAGGLARINWSLSPETDIVLIVLGGNDALRAIDPGQTRANLDALIFALKERGVEILLSGMRAPPNLGSEYADGFEPIYPTLAEKYDVLLYPFILDGVAADPALNQQDGIHPNAAGVNIIVAGLMPLLIELLDKETDIASNDSNDRP